jgi:SOS-response transcriptional repressor LexA
MTAKTLLSQRLRAARSALHPPVTQRAVAKWLKLSPSAVNLWEAGKTEPSASDLAELARRYHVSLDWLCGVEVEAKAQAKGRPPVHTVPVVSPTDLVRWHWEAVSEMLQTSVAYPNGTAAAILVASDALTSSCPAGAYAVISKSHGMRPGHVVLAAIGRASEPVLRRFVREAGDEMLIADDTRYPTLRLEDGVRILGRVTEVTLRKVFN